MTRFLLAPVRCLALLVLAGIGFGLVLLAIAAAILIVPYPLAAKGIRGLADLGRRLARRWSGVAIGTESRSQPPVPQRRPDGWYVYDNQLYKSPRMPTFLLEMRALGEDRQLIREWSWLFLSPFVGAVAVLVPVALITLGGLVAAGTVTAITGGGWAVAAGLVLVLAGLGLGPAMLTVHARWTKSALEPGQRSWWHRSGLGPWVSARMDATWHGGGLAGLSLAAIGGFLLNLVAGIGSWAVLLPQATLFTRPAVTYYRGRVRRWAGVEIDEPYRPFPPPPGPESDGRYRVGRSLLADRAAAIRWQRRGWVLGDQATWRDLLWMATAWLLSAVWLVPAVLVSVGFFGLVWQVATWAPWAVPVGLSTGYWITPWYLWYGLRYAVPGAAVVPDWASPLVGLALTLVGLLLAIPLLRLRSRLDRLLLGPTRSARLAQRVQRLTETRTEAVDAQAAELRRIERDLHDGAQARLIGVGLSLATVEHLLETDPVTARALLAQARESSSTALTELRQLVRGIHPPVLSERGLVDAVRAVALDTPLPVRVTAQLDGRPEPPVESAAYFAACEALANAVRHARAHQVEIDIRHADGRLRLTVTDDGVGGADPARGSGLAGLRRRLATFDGTLTLHSPRGGPTELTMEIPCALSSPKTSTS